MKKIGIVFICCWISLLAMAQPGTSWSLCGPIKFPTNVSGQINGIGRCTQLKFDPVNPAKMYATSSSGGLWMTSDTGSTWSNVGTDYFPNVQCASICIDYTNTNTLYLGTGDPNYYSNGLGVYKSTNGGLTWASSSTGITTGLIVELIMDPTNNQTILAATDNGIFKTTTAGASWTSVKNGGDFKAMVMKPNSNDTVYAVTSSEVWRSLDFGTTWSQITAGMYVPNNNGLGLRLAVSSASANVVYVGMIANEGLILQSTDFGTTYNIVYNNSAQSLVGYDAVTPGQGDYNFGMTADPSNANTVYVAAHCVWKSTDGGITWSKLTNWYAGCHTDMHGIAVHPAYPNMLFDINDGGVFLSRDGGTTWIAKSDGEAATEIYHAAQSNQVRNQVSIGTQDNGELFMTGTVLSGNTWYTNGGGDLGSRLKYSYSASNEVYYYDNGNRRTVTGSQTSCNFPFPTSNNMELEFNRKLPNVAFSAYQGVYTCTNLSSGSPSWTSASNITSQVAALHSSFADSAVLYMLDQNNTLYRCDNIFAATPPFFNYSSPGPTGVACSIASIASNSNVVYVSCGSSVYRSANKGQTFSNINSGLPGGVNIIKLIHDEYSTNEGMYLCTAKGVYYKNNSLPGWTNISYNLPTIADIQDFMLYNTGTAASVLRIGYYGRGVWELPINVSLPPAADFTSDKQTLCANTSVQFTDLSISTPTPSSWQWSFPGGTPATSTSQNPSILYTTPGNYPVTLVAGNTNGTGSVTVQAYIQVINPQSLPVQEGFSAGFPPNQWSLFDDGQDNVNWLLNSTVGGYGNSSQSTYFDNYNNDVNGKRDGLITKTYNFSGVTNPTLWFDVAFARWGPNYSDSLMVLASTNCGQSYTSIYYKGGTALATAADDQNYFVPTSSQWRTEAVSMSAFAGQPSVLLAFQNRGHYGNTIYIDNINIFNSVALDAGVSAILSPTTVGCYNAATPLTVSITNYGTNALSTIPVTAIIAGPSNQTYTGTYTGNIPSGGSANLSLGNVDMSLSGVYTFSISTGLSGDGNAGNDLYVGSFTAAPLFAIAGPTLLCPGNSATLSINGASAFYSWFNGSTALSITVSPTVSTVFSAIGTDTSGCSASQTLTMTVQNPTVIASASSSLICTGESTTLTASGTLTYSWTPGGQTMPSIIVAPGTTTRYFVTGITNSCSDTSSVLITVDVCTGLKSNALLSDRIDIYPNPNNGNMTVSLPHSEAGEHLIEIYDLAGKLVYRAVLKNEDNLISIKELANGTYDYKIRSLSSNTLVKTGKIVKNG